MTNQWRLYYKDSNSNNQVLAGLNDEDLPSDAYSIKQARWKTRSRSIDKLSLIAEGDMFKNVPREENNDFGTTEPAIFWTGRRFQTAITGVDTTNDEFVVSGDRTNDFEEGGHIEVIGSTGNDGIYKVADPSDVTYDSNNDETTIAVVEDVTDSTADGDLEAWENIFRGWPDSQGKITEQGVLKLTLFDFIKYLGMQEVNVSTTGTIKDAMLKLTPSDYTLDTPSSSNVDYIDSTGTTTSGFAPLDDWSLTNVDRGVGFREMIRNYGYVLKAKANKELRYEPVGFGSSIDTIDSPAEGDTNNTQGNWKEWTAGDTSVANLVNVVRVVNSKSGTKHDSGILTNSTSVNKYGKQTPKGGNPVKKGYVSSDTEAKRVARNIIRDSQNPTEGGRIKVAGRYTNNVSNSSFTLNDSTRDISSEVFVAWSQVNFYPENKTILEMQYENQDENETNLTDDIRAERSKIYPTSQTGVGNQNVNANTEDVNESYDAHDAQNHNHDVAGKTSDAAGGASRIDFGDSIASDNNSINAFSTFTTVETFSPAGGNSSGMQVIVTGENDSLTSGTESANEHFWIKVQNQSTGVDYPTSSGVPVPAFESGTTDEKVQLGPVSIWIPENTDGQTYEVQVAASNAGESGWDFFTTYMVQGEHSHNIDAEAGRAQDDTDGSVNNTNPSDSSAGDTTSLDADGSTDAKNINTTVEENTDR